jgi:DedD protein
VSEAERARALLEGRSGKVAAANPAAPVPVAAIPAGGDRFIVQVGAFSDEAKVRDARQKLERAGITTYTQVVQTKDGKRTRVRVGPFQGREQAEKASVKIKSLGLAAAILTL